jgi:hypothetical protein
MAGTATEVPLADLDAAYRGSWYFIAGAGGDLQEWIDGYEGLLAEQGIEKPRQWFRTVGAEINRFAEHQKGGLLAHRDAFQADLTCLLFPLDGLNMGRLPLFKIRMEDRWFDDVIQNMRVAS